MKNVALTAVAVALIASAWARAAEDCVSGKNHYEGSPHPNVYVVEVSSSCAEKREVTLRIMSATTLEEIDRATFFLEPGQSREFRREYSGEQLFMYAIDHRPAD